MISTFVTCRNWGKDFKGQGYAFLALTHAMLDGDVKGLFCFGQNPAVGGANARLIRAGLDKLDWLVVADLFEHETAMFWKRPGVDSAKIPTEVFVLPACSGVEKAGSIVNSGRWAQWRYQAVKPIADCRPDLDIVDGIVKAMKRVYDERRSVSRSRFAISPGTMVIMRIRIALRARTEWTLRDRCTDKDGKGLRRRKAGVRLRPVARRWQHHVRATGSIAAAIRMKAIWQLDVIRAMRRTRSGSIRNGHGHGR